MNEFKSTTDVWYASFLIKNGYKVESFDVIGRGKARFYFDLTEEQWKDYKLKFNNSEIVGYKAVIEQLKDLCY